MDQISGFDRFSALEIQFRTFWAESFIPVTHIKIYW